MEENIKPGGLVSPVVTVRYSKEEVRTMQKDLAHVMGVTTTQGIPPPLMKPPVLAPFPSQSKPPPFVPSATQAAPQPPQPPRPTITPPILPLSPATPTPPLPREHLTPTERLTFSDAASRPPAESTIFPLRKTPAATHANGDEEDILFAVAGTPQPSAPAPRGAPPASLPIAPPPPAIPRPATPPSMPKPPTPLVPQKPFAPPLPGISLPQPPPSRTAFSLALLVGVLLLLVLGGGGYWFFLRPAPPPVPPQPPPSIEEEQPPVSLVPGASNYVLAAENLTEFPRAFQNALSLPFSPGFTIIHLQQKKGAGRGTYIRDLDTALTVLGLTIPGALRQTLNDTTFNLFVHAGTGGNRPGIAVAIRDYGSTQTLLPSWSATLLQDAQPLITALNGTFPQRPMPFLTNTYKNHCILYQNFPDPATTLDIVLIPWTTPIFGVATSRQSAWDLIDAFDVFIELPPQNCG